MPVDGTLKLVLGLAAAQFGGPGAVSAVNAAVGLADRLIDAHGERLQQMSRQEVIAALAELEDLPAFDMRDEVHEE